MNINKFNRWLALKVTDCVSSIWCAYIFAIIACVSLPAAIASHQLLIIVSWIAQTFLQLVLLSILMVGQKLQADATIKHVNKKHEEMKLHISSLKKGQK